MIFIVKKELKLLSDQFVRQPLSQPGVDLPTGGKFLEKANNA
jgi:hypothetical protein